VLKFVLTPAAECMESAIKRAEEIVKKTRMQLMVAAI